MNTLNFNDADLKANREGRLSDAQMKRFEAEADRLQAQYAYSLGSVGAALSCGAIVMMGIASFMISLMAKVYNTPGSGQNPAELPADIRLLVVVMSAIYVISACLFIFQIMRHNARIHILTNASLRTIEGIAEVISTYSVSRHGKRTPINKLILHSNRYSWLTFDFESARSLSPFKNGGRYRVYYLPYAEPQVLSMEEIEPEKLKHQEYV